MPQFMILGIRFVLYAEFSQNQWMIMRGIANHADGMGAETQEIIIPGA